jgi:hypothetical protein
MNKEEKEYKINKYLKKFPTMNDCIKLGYSKGSLQRNNLASQACLDEFRSLMNSK